MSAQIALLNSAMTHGARILAGSPDRYVNGIPIVRLGDPISCPKDDHGINRIVHVNVSQQTDSKPVAHVGAVAECGAEIITGSESVYVG